MCYGELSGVKPFFWSSLCPYELQSSAPKQSLVAWSKKKAQWIQFCKPNQRWVGLQLSNWNYFVSTTATLLVLRTLADNTLSKNHPADAGTLSHALILCFFSPLLIEPSLVGQNSRLTASSALEKHLGITHRHQPCIPYRMRGDSNNYVSGRSHPSQATDS